MAPYMKHKRTVILILNQSKFLILWQASLIGIEYEIIVTKSKLNFANVHISFCPAHKRKQCEAVRQVTLVEFSCLEWLKSLNS